MQMVVHHNVDIDHVNHTFTFTNLPMLLYSLTPAPTQSFHYHICARCGLWEFCLSIQDFMVVWYRRS